MNKQNEIVMYNPKNGVKVVITKDFMEKWKKLGFVELHNVTLFKLAG